MVHLAFPKSKWYPEQEVSLSHNVRQLLRVTKFRLSLLMDLASEDIQVKSSLATADAAASSNNTPRETHVVNPWNRIVIVNVFV